MLVINSHTQLPINKYVNENKCSREIAALAPRTGRHDRAVAFDLAIQVFRSGRSSGFVCSHYCDSERKRSASYTMIMPFFGSFFDFNTM